MATATAPAIDLDTVDLENPVTVPVTSSADLADQIDQRLRALVSSAEAASGETPTLLLAVPAPRMAPETLLDVSDRPLGLVWDPPEGLRIAGLDAVHRLRMGSDGASWSDQCADLRRRARALLGSVTSESLAGASVVDPRLWGGLAFDVDAAAAEPWTPFGRGELCLPRFVYAAGDQAASLALAITAREAADDAQRTALGRELLDLVAQLEAAKVASADADLESVASRDWPVADTVDQDWVRRVEEIRDAIRRGEVEKIVAARRSKVDLPDRVTAPGVLRRLARRGLRASTRFAFCRPGAAFVGATPERLITKTGRRLATEALAGSIDAGEHAEAHAAELLGSGKDRHEQQLVTDSIVRRLAPLCASLDVAERPTVRVLRDVLHLHTPIRGELAEDLHVLDLVAALHPTPAVGGVPTRVARRWIAERETHPRGWYAAPIGWLDAQGDGEFFVALRSCVLVDGTQDQPAVAFLFAGAGIVADSDPHAELRETELKRRTLLAALGVAPATESGPAPDRTVDSTPEPVPESTPGEVRR